MTSAKPLKKTPAKVTEKAKAKAKIKPKKQIRADSSEVEIIAILDRSGSMESDAKEVIGGYNHFIKKQKDEPGEAVASLTIFDDEVEVVYSGVKIDNVPKLTKLIYYTRGTTALNDAVGMTLTEAKGRLKKEKRKPYVLVLIVTDGLENASHEYSTAQVKKMVKDLQAKHGWEFAFLGVNMDAFSASAGIGIAARTARGTQGVYDSSNVSEAFTLACEHVAVYREHVRNEEQ